MGKKGGKKTGGRKQFVGKVVCNVCKQWENIPVDCTTKRRKNILRFWKRHMYRHMDISQCSLCDFTLGFSTEKKLLLKPMGSHAKNVHPENKKRCHFSKINDFSDFEIKKNQTSNEITYSVTNKKTENKKRTAAAIAGREVEVKLNKVKRLKPLL